MYWCLNRYVSLSHLSVLTVIVIKSGHVLEDSCFFFGFYSSVPAEAVTTAMIE